jgi:hypothetical protein
VLEGGLLDKQVAIKCLYLVTRSLDPTGTGRTRWTMRCDVGRLTVRERIAALLDEGSFHEVGALAGTAGYDESGELASFIGFTCQSFPSLSLEPAAQVPAKWHLVD